MEAVDSLNVYMMRRIIAPLSVAASTRASKELEFPERLQAVSCHNVSHNAGM